METKTLAFDVRDIKRFKEFFPDFKSGKMSGRELGSKLLEVLDNQSASAAISFQSEEDAFKGLQVQFQELQEHCKQLEAQLADNLAGTVAEPAAPPKTMTCRTCSKSCNNNFKKPSTTKMNFLFSKLSSYTDVQFMQ